MLFPRVNVCDISAVANAWRQILGAAAEPSGHQTLAGCLQAQGRRWRGAAQKGERAPGGKKQRRKLICVQKEKATWTGARRQQLSKTDATTKVKSCRVKCPPTPSSCCWDKGCSTCVLLFLAALADFLLADVSQDCKQHHDADGESHCHPESHGREGEVLALGRTPETLLFIMLREGVCSIRDPMVAGNSPCKRLMGFGNDRRAVAVPFAIHGQLLMPV